MQLLHLDFCLPKNVVKIFFAFVCILFYGCKNNEEEIHADYVLIDNYFKASRAFLDVDKPDKAVHFIDSAYHATDSLSNNQLWQKQNYKVGIYLNHTSDFKKAKLAIDTMYTLLDGLHEEYPEDYVRTTFHEGELLIRSKNYDAGLKKFYEGEDFAKKHLEPCQINQFTERIALLKYRQKRYLEAIPYFKKHLIGLTTCDTVFVNDIYYPQSSLTAIALCFEKEKFLDSAVVYYKKAATLIKDRIGKYPKNTAHATSSLGVIYGNLGGVYAKQGENDLAESLLKQSIQINSQPGQAIFDANLVQLKLASLYIKNNRLNDARKILDSLKVDINSWELPYNDLKQQIVLHYQELNWQLLDKSDSPMQAYSAFKRYTALKDSLATEERAINQQDLESVFKIAQSEYELESLSNSNKVTSLYMWGAILFAALMIVILALIIAYLQRFKKHHFSLTKLNDDISEKNKHLEGTLTELERSHEDNYRMMKIIYHDLRSPIGGMTMATSLMLEDKHHSEEDLEMLRMINTSGQDAIGLINDMLQINTDVELSKEIIKVQELLQYCSAMLQFKAKEKGQSITTQSDEIEILIDQEKIRRVLNNLLSNAVKFSPLQSRIILSGQLQGNNILITCEDFGIGIPTEQLETVFDMFTEAKRIGTMGEVTFGMGLAICRQIINAHKGKIWCENKEIGGSIFKILLPIAHH
ncbi:MAG: hypothetical protein EOO42_05705 [Flavobacteriales bacterium]|nr:MAG: hypothetical protein EOO42_05705 [Flavobacteriales bacterium]